MAMTPEQVAQDEQNFSASFEDGEPPEKTGSDDEAFGLTPVAEMLEGDEAMPNSPEEANEVVQESAAEEAAEPAAVQAQGQQLTPEEQRLKSWEGRLKAREAELKAAGGAPAAEDEVVESQAEEVGEQVAAKVDGMDPDAAMKALAADFGDDFTNMIATIIDAKVAQVTSKVSQSVEEIIGDIKDSKARTHFETIADRHPDFMEIAGSDEFKAYCESDPTAGKVAAQGTAREINKMLDKFVASSKKPEQAQEDDNIDAAEGVRSTGMRLPTQPTGSNDFSAAWDEFKD